MQPFDVTKIRFFLGPDQTPVAGFSDEHVRTSVGDWRSQPWASGEEFAQAAASTIPLSYAEVDGLSLDGTCIITADGRVVGVSKAGTCIVIQLTPDGAARVRASLEAKS